ncbi:sodium transport system permease protein [Natronincola peptidivorans]|uniref:Sodium transport system permease protein n=1 Tax=Natronincola peptidivorans TaxID=426128 RepID=A0A1I0GS67_9FIRM|nr:ABC transporter permease subunit/CPBP intramembrane protease [Natronincola peptidivorans]SET74026.1 sodium transport system permease protein [Natronincola peptidivorans]
MNFSIVLNLLKKEILALSRNKRIIIGLILPVLLLPLLFYGFNQVQDMTARGSEASLSRIHLVGEIPDEVLDALYNDARLEIIEDVENYEKLIQNRELDLVLEYSYSEDIHRFEFKFDSGRSGGRRASERIEGYLLDFKEEEQLKLLTLANEDESLLNPVNLQMKDIAMEEDIMKHSLSNIIPIALTLYALLSVVNFAVELTTAEKELGTLETLFSVPIKKKELIVAKIVACVLFGLVSMIISLLILLAFAPRFIDIEILHFAADPSIAAVLVLTLFPLIVMGAGVSLGVGMFANSYRESGAYITPLIFAFMIPAYIGSTPGLELNAFYAMLPIINSTLLIKSVFVGGLDIYLFAITLVTNTLFSVMSLTFMFKVFGTEKILFGIGKGTSFKLRRKELKRRDFIEVEDVFMSLSIIVILYIYMSTVLTEPMGIVRGTIFMQVFVFALIPIGIIWYLKGSQKKNLGMRMPSALGMLGGVFLWVAAFSLNFIYQILITPFVSQIPTLVELEAQLQILSPLTIFFFIAVTPGICEEILFRGFAFRPIEKNLGPKAAIIITSLMFAVVHLDFVRLFPTFLLGLVFGYVAYKTKSIYPAIVLHILNNAFAAFMPSGMPLTLLNLSIVFIIASIVGYVLLEKKHPLLSKAEDEVE